ncbi:MAG TPA: ABC transporter permease [Terriglobia bacterium]|nr:ABC transporter permease [Terriglobia bacterium]
MRWYQRLFRRARTERQLDAELRFHLEQQIADYIAAGMLPEEARRRARLEFGGLDQVKEECRDVGAAHFIETLIQDVRYGLRQLRRNPGFTAVAVLTLALGIGACTALFSVVNGVLLNPLPYPEPGRLVTVDASKPNFPNGSISYPNFLDWHRMNQCFSFFAVSRPTGFLLTGVGAPEELNAAAVTSDFFPLLGIKPVLGRSFTSDEDRIGMSHVAAISTDLWRQKFRGSSTVIGKEISLDGKGYTIVGIFPGHLDLPMGYFSAVDVYIPLGQFGNPLLNNRLAGFFIHGIARLKPGITLQQARDDMQRVTAYLAKVYPEADRGTGAALSPLTESIVGDVRGFLLLLLGAVGFVLLIACVNIANILLARGNARSREMAVRSALGAGTMRLVRQMLSESAVLAMLGGAAGLAFAALGTRIALAVLPATLPRASEVGIDGRVLWFTVIVSLCAGILFGTLPAIRTARRSAHESLKEGARGSAGGSRHRAQGLLISLQMALALVLLAGAGLLIRSLSQLWKVKPGFDPNHILIFNLALPPQMDHAQPEAIRAALRNFDAAISSVPGAEAESLSWSTFPMYSEDDEHFWVYGQPRPASDSQMHGMLDYIVGPEYLKAMRIPLLAGRFFTEADNEHSRLVVAVDEAFARKYFPHESAVGKAICQGDQAHTFCYDIIGVVGHVMQWGLDTDSENPLRAQVYFPFMQLPDSVVSLVSGTSVVVRSRGNDVRLIASIRRASDRLNRNEVLTSFQSMHGIIQSSLAPRRFAMMLLGAFAAFALFLAGIGLYGVVAYAVGQRTHEIGIRMALGAQRRDVFRLVIGQGLGLALIGLAIGAAASLILIRLLSSFSQLLYGVSKSDPPTFIAVSVALLAVALLACYIPARRAAKVNPMTALRHE